MASTSRRRVSLVSVIVSVTYEFISIVRHRSQLVCSDFECHQPLTLTLSRKGRGDKSSPVSKLARQDYFLASSSALVGDPDGGPLSGLPSRLCSQPFWIPVCGKNDGRMGCEAANQALRNPTAPEMSAVASLCRYRSEIPHAERPRPYRP